VRVLRLVQRLTCLLPSPLLDLMAGPMTLSGIRVNGLDLVRQLSGQMCITGTGKVVIKARGTSGVSPPSVVAAGRTQEAEVGGHAGCVVMRRIISSCCWTEQFVCCRKCCMAS
jgi:hypothetical protein